jgi:hypothetical protein
MELQVEALFACDESGRLLHPNTPGEEGRAPPRFFLGRTRCGNLWRFGAGVVDARAAELARLAAGERIDLPLEAPPERMDAFVAHLARDAPVERVAHGPAFRFPEPEGRAPPGGVVEVTPERAELVAETFPELARTLAARQPCFAVVEAGRAVSTCYCATYPRRAVEAGVDTLPGHRGRGFASRALVAWAGAVRERGLLPLYSTGWSSRSSLAVAARLGLIRYGVDLHFR